VQFNWLVIFVLAEISQNPCALILAVVFLPLDTNYDVGCDAHFMQWKKNIFTPNHIKTCSGFFF
jgi:hypothetical protein